MYGLYQSILGLQPFVFNGGLLIAKSFGDWHWNQKKKTALSSRFLVDIQPIIY